MTTALDLDIVETHNCKAITVLDTSVYAPGFVISQATLTIHTPGSTQPAEYEFMARKINVINSNNLNITCADTIEGVTVLNDGIYKIVYTVKPAETYKVEKTFLRACKLQCKMDNILYELGITSCDPDPRRALKLEKLKEVDFLILAAHAAARNCNMKLALDLYKKADQELTRLGGNCNQ